MRCLVVIMALLSASAIAAQPAGHVSELESNLKAVDREMIELLLLRDDQIDGYLKVIRTSAKPWQYYLMRNGRNNWTCIKVP